MGPITAWLLCHKCIIYARGCIYGDWESESIAFHGTGCMIACMEYQSQKVKCSILCLSTEYGFDVSLGEITKELFPLEATPCMPKNAADEVMKTLETIGDLIAYGVWFLHEMHEEMHQGTLDLGWVKQKVSTMYKDIKASIALHTNEVK